MTRYEVVTALLGSIFKTLILYGEVRVRDVFLGKRMGPSDEGLGEDAVHDSPVIPKYILISDVEDFPPITIGGHEVVPIVEDTMGSHTPQLAGVFVFDCEYRRLFKRAPKKVGGKVLRGVGMRPDVPGMRT